MKLINIALLLLINFNLLSQQVAYKYDKRISFVLSGKNNEGLSVSFNSTNKNVPIVGKSYKSGTESSIQFATFFYKYKNQMYKMEALNIDKYIVSNGNTTYQKSNGVHTFKEVKDSVYEYENEKNLTKRIAEVSKGVVVEMYTKNNGDGINYNEPTLHFMAEYFGITPQLELGEMMVYCTLNEKKNSIMSFSSTIEDIDETMCFDYEEMNAYLDGNYSKFTKKREAVLESPVFCSVTAVSKTTDERTIELIEQVLGNMCSFHTVWANYLQKQEFKNIYLKEVNRLYNLYKTHKVLSIKQVDSFKKELLSYSTEL